VGREGSQGVYGHSTQVSAGRGKEPRKTWCGKGNSTQGEGEEEGRGLKDANYIEKSPVGDKERPMSETNRIKEQSY